MTNSEEPKSRRRLRFLLYPACLWLLLVFLAAGWLTPAVRAQAVQPVTLVNVMVLYTPKAAAGAGGAPALLRQIDQAVYEANTVFQNSRINARIILVKAAAINYTESGILTNDLARLRNPNDSVFKLARLWRDQNAADLVCLVTETGSDRNFYGLQGPSEPNAFSIIRRPYLTGLNYFPVVLSFNFGCQSESYYAGSAGAFPYAYGYSLLGGNGGQGYCTVEAFSGTRLPFFSNPDIMIDGRPAGIPAGQPGAANNALVINQTAPLVAAFRGTAVKDFPPVISIRSPTAEETVCSGTNLPLTALASDADGKVTSVDYYFDDTNKIATVSTAPFSAIWHNVPAGSHSVTAVATDNLHAPTVSSPNPISVLPANDNFAGRSPILVIPASLLERNDLATAEPGEPYNNGVPAAHSLWWTWTAPADAVMSLSVAGSSLPLNLTVYTGTNLNNLSNVALSGTPLVFRVKAGTSYQITADNADGATGEVAFQLAPSPVPANDDFAKRTKLAGNALTIRASNQYATREPDEPFHNASSTGASLWWSWTAPTDGQVTIHVTSDTQNNLLAAVYTGNALTNLSWLVTGSFEYWDSYYGNLDFLAQAGVTYQIAIDNEINNYPGSLGPFTFNFKFHTAPPNDNFAKRTTISGSWINLTNSSILATLEPDEPGHLYYADSSIWWSWTAPFSGVVTLTSATGQGLDVYTGNSLKTLIPVPLAADGTFSAKAGTRYDISASGGQTDVALSLILSTVHITCPADGKNFVFGKTIPNILLTASTSLNDGTIWQVEYFANGTLVGISKTAPYKLYWHPPVVGDYALTAVAIDNFGHPRSSRPVSISVKYPHPANDNFANRARLQGTWLNLTESNLEATQEPGEPDIAETGWANSIWWQWTAPAAGLVTLSSTNGDGFGVFTGSSLATLAPVTNGSSPVTFAAVAGKTYNLAAVGPDGNVTMKLSLSNLKITSPADGVSFTNGSSITLQAAATPTEAPVRQVEFFANGISLGKVTNAPYQLSWTNIPGGDYALTAVATDNLGHDRCSPPVNISLHPVNDDFANRTELHGSWILVTNSIANATSESEEQAKYPTYYAGNSIWWKWTASGSGWVTLSSPESGSYFFGVSLLVYTGDSLSNLTLVTFSGGYGNGSIFFGTSPVSFSVTAGTTYNIRAINSQFGFPVGFPGSFTLGSLSSPPFDSPVSSPGGFLFDSPSSETCSLQLVFSGLRIESPVSNQRLPAGASLAISVTNADIGNPLSQVEVFYNGGVQRRSIGDLTSPPFNFIWTNLPIGGQTLTAVGTDNQGHTFSSPPVSISVTPTNDDFANRTILTGIPLAVAGTTYNSTAEDEGYFLSTSNDHTVWYTWTAPISGTIHVAAGENYPTSCYLGVYAGDALTNLVLLNESWDGMTFSAVAGTTYQIRVDGVYGNFNVYHPEFILDLAAQPTNESFAAAIPISGNQATMTGDGSFAAGNSLWYSWTAPARGIAKVSFSSSSSYSFKIYSGDSVSNLTAIASVSSYNSYGDSGSFDTTPGTTYRIAVDGGSGLFTLSFDFAPVPDNDLFANRTPLAGVSVAVQGSTRAATIEPGEPNLSGYSGERSVWYAWTSPADGFVRLQRPQGYIGVFTGDALANLTSILSGVENGAATFDAVAGQTYPISVVQTPWGPDTFTWSLQMAKVAITNPVAGATYAAGTNLLLAASPIDLEGTVTSVAFYTNSQLVAVITNRPFSLVLSNLPLGDYRLSAQATDEHGKMTTSKAVAFLVTPANDNFASRIRLTGTSGTLTSTNNTATIETGEYQPHAANGRTTWWTWTAPTNGSVTFTSNGGLQDFLPPNYQSPADGSQINFWDWYYDSGNAPLVSVYLGSSLTNLSLYASNRVYISDITGTNGQYGWTVLTNFSFPVLAGQTCQISLDGAGYYTGIASVNFALGPLQRPPPAPVNDNFARRTILTGASVTTNGTTADATLELSDPDLGGGLDARTVWYTWTAPASGPVSVDVYRPGIYSFPPRLGIFAGSAPGSLILLATGGYFYTPFYALAGTAYQIELASSSKDVMNFVLEIHSPTPPAMFPTNALRQSDGSYKINVVGSVGQSFVIQSSLNKRDWTTIHTDTLLASSMDYTDPQSRSTTLRYYRVLPLDTVLNTQPLKMLTPSLVPAGGFSLNFTGTSGLPIKIQTSTNLVDWYDLTSGIFINNAFNFTDYDAPNYPHRFYRSVQP